MNIITKIGSSVVDKYTTEDKYTTYFSKNVGHVADYDCYNEFDNPYDNATICTRSSVLEEYKID